MSISKESPDIGLNSSTICPVTGLPIIRRPEWTDVSFGSDYSITVSIVDGRVLLVQPSGYVTTDNQINVMKLTEQAPAEAISEGQPYVHIEDWSNFQGASLGERKYYMDTMKKRDRISGVIYYGVSSMLKMSIKLGRRLNIVKFSVHIVDDYSEAVRLALEIQSKDKALVEKPVTAPSLEKDAAINVCPVTSLPVTAKPEWTDIRIGDNYSVSFSLIGDAILLSVGNGCVPDTVISRHKEEREKVLRDVGLKDKKYIEIRDHGIITEAASKKGRMTVANLILEEVSAGKIRSSYGER